jgi:hypothetical protein
MNPEQQEQGQKPQTTHTQRRNVSSFLNNLVWDLYQQQPKHFTYVYIYVHIHEFFPSFAYNFV